MASEPDVAARAEQILGTVPDPALVELLLARACGHPSLTDHLVSAWRDAGSIERGSLVMDPEMTPADVADAVVAIGAELSREARTALTALSIGPALDDRLLVALCDRPVEAAPEIWQELRAAGVLVPDHEEPLPVVADAVAARIEPSVRRDLHRRIGELLSERGAPPAQIADHLVAAEARGPEAANVLAAAGEAALAEAPAVASDLLARAVDAGVDPAVLAGARAEAAALSGDEDRAIALADGAIGGSPESTARAELVLAGVLARRGLWARAVRSYGSIVEHPRLHERAVAGLRSVATVALGEGGSSLVSPDAAAPGAIVNDAAISLGNAAHAAATGDAVAARRHAGEAADLLEAGAAPVVLPETPHAIATLVALAAGDSEDAERMAARAVEAEIGGPAATHRHRLLGGFAAMRAGRWDRAQQALDATTARLTTRDELLRGALAAALARRGGDTARLVESWEAVARPLGATHGDLFLVLPLAELIVVAARLGHRDAIAPREAEVDAVLDGLGRPGLWARPLAWARVEAAVARESVDELETATNELAAAAPAHERLVALEAAAQAWRNLFDGSSEGLDDGVAALERAGLVWEASRLVGQAAIRADDPRETRSLLGRARELKGTLPVLDVTGAPTGTVLSAREQEIAACVVDGLTHKEIGAMLFISPKTVEHHVARIRQKLGATSRAELLAGLRTTLAAAD